MTDGIENTPDDNDDLVATRRSASQASSRTTPAGPPATEGPRPVDEPGPVTGEQETPAPGPLSSVAEDDGSPAPITSSPTEADTAVGESAAAAADQAPPPAVAENATGAAGLDKSGQDSDQLLETEGEVAADYLEELLDVADLDGDIDTYVENQRAQVSVITESKQLIGNDGEVLEALQELTRLAVTNQTGERSRLMLDVGGFRQDRRRKLTELATDVIDEVKTSGESVRLDPMNSFERKIVHDAVAAAGLTSRSDGAEPERRVVVHPSA